MNKFIVEFIGTFFLVLTVGMTVIEPGAGAMAPLAIGASLMVMIFAGGHISGAHYNPAVTLAVWIRGKCPTSDVPGYIAAQVLAGVAAAFTVLYLKDIPALTPAASDDASVRWLVAEILGTFALAFVVLNVATAKGTSNNSFYGLAIGFTVTAMAYGLGTVSGGAFNPAVAVGITIMGLKAPADFWIYLIGCCAGGAGAGFLFKKLLPEDK